MNWHGQQGLQLVGVAGDLGVDGLAGLEFGGEFPEGLDPALAATGLTGVPWKDSTASPVAGASAGHLLSSLLMADRLGSRVAVRQAAHRVRSRNARSRSPSEDQDQEEAEDYDGEDAAHYYDCGLAR
jgi:hypothetical protein